MMPINDEEEIVNDNSDEINIKSNPKKLTFIKMNSKAFIEEYDQETKMKDTFTLYNIVNSSIEEQSIENDYNNFFIKILPENQEKEQLKVNYEISKKFKINKFEYNNALDEILNMNESTSYIVTKSFCEYISIILASIFKKIRKINKSIKNYKDFLKYIENGKKENIFIDIYNRYYNKNYIRKSSTQYRNTLIINQSDEDIVEENDISVFNIQDNKNISNIFGFQVIDKKEKNYVFKEKEDDNNFKLPIEMIILLKKFENVQKLKFTIGPIQEDNYKELFNTYNLSSNYNYYKKDDVTNIIFVLLNIEWLFPKVVEIEYDISNQNIIQDEFKIYNEILKKILSIKKRVSKKTNYSIRNSVRVKREYDPLDSSFLGENEENIISEIEDNKFYNKKIKTFKNLEEKYEYTIQMIVIFNYFISKIDKLFILNLFVPYNYENLVLKLFSFYDLCITEFNSLAFLKECKVKDLTFDFNCIDTKVSEKVIAYIFKNEDIERLRLSFFPTEEFFSPESLFKILMDNNPSYRKLIKTDKKKFEKVCEKLFAFELDEEMDHFLLRQLSKYFELNINNFFSAMTYKFTQISYLSLVFDLPNLLCNNEQYTSILMKLFINLFICLDEPKSNIISFSLVSENFYLDARKNPIIDDFFKGINIYNNPNQKIVRFSCLMKFSGLKYIYKIIPYNVKFLSLGTFDAYTFNSFVNYITSSENSLHTLLEKLTIHLNKSIVELNQIKNSFYDLLEQYPKNLKELTIFSSLIINYDELYNLLKLTNYNTIENLYIQINKKSISFDESFAKKINIDESEHSNNVSSKELKIKDNSFKLFYIKRNKKTSNFLINFMARVSKKYNNKFMDFNIFLGIEKFLVPNTLKNMIIQIK